MHGVSLCCVQADMCILCSVLKYSCMLECYARVEMRLFMVYVIITSNSIHVFKLQHTYLYLVFNVCV